MTESEEIPTPEGIFVICSENLCGIKVTVEAAMKMLDTMNWYNLPTLDVIH